jgi:hypothetical protein
MNASTINATTMQLLNGGNPVAATVFYHSPSRTAYLAPAAPLSSSTAYSATVTSGVMDLANNALAGGSTWSFTTAAPVSSLNQGAGGPVLIVTTTSNPFGFYYAEILRAEGLNEFATVDIASVTSSLLASYDVVILTEQSLTSSRITMFTTWVQGGGRLIAMRPPSGLASLLGLTRLTPTLSNSYFGIDTTQAPGAGLPSATMQYHGTADEYTLNGARAVATLYSTSTGITAFPAVSLNNVGSNGGQAAAFAFDLAKSVVYTRQGNPAWSGQERDALPPVRPDDLFFGAKVGDIQDDWVDVNKILIPQADEQQRLLANLVLHMNSSRRPLPRFWYLPRGFKAAVVMTGDDHGNNGTTSRFNQYIAASPAGCSITDWECIRGTSYVYTNTPISNTQVASFTAQGFEIALHHGVDPSHSTCGSDFSLTNLQNTYATQRQQFATTFPSAPAPVTSRTHCIVFPDWSSQPQVEAANGVRLDTNYYYWPASWILDRPGLFTGSGMPMRFAALDGSMINVYQAATQMTDESGQTYPLHVDTLLDNAIGVNGYYGVFTANMHTDFNPSTGSDAIVASAKARGVPVVSARQMLTWIDGRNTSQFGPISASGSDLTFSVAAGAGATGLTVIVPAKSGSAALVSLTLNGIAVPYTTTTLKGVQYAVTAAAPGLYRATYN